MKCPHCGLLNPETAQRCDCGYDFEKKTIEKPYEPVRSKETVAIPPHQAHESSFPAALMTRYADAYLVARATVKIGGIVKGLAILLGIVVTGFGVIYANRTNNDATAVIGGVVFAFIVGVPLYVLGILVSAQGQILKASLDTAVNTSTLLKNDDRARIMHLL